MFGKKALADLKALVFLYAVSQCEGKRKAAKAMGISVDTVTKYIKYLEQECGTDLLSSYRGESRLTSRGAQFASFAEELTHELKHMYALVADYLDAEDQKFGSKDLRNLEAYVALRAIHYCMGKRKAAEAQGLSVDTLSKYIADFENNIHLKLVCEKGRICSLTSDGLMVMNELENIVDIWERFCREKGSCQKVCGKVRVGIDLSISSTIPSENVMEFFEKYPLLELEIVPLQNVEDDCKNCDICISRQPIEKTTDLALIYKKMLPCGYFAAPQYLAKYGCPRDLQDMSENHRLVSRGNVKVYSPDFQRILKEASQVCLVSASGAAMLNMIRFGAGIGLLPLRFKNEGLVCLNNLKCDTKVFIFLSAKRRLKDIPRVRATLNYYKDVLAAM